MEAIYEQPSHNGMKRQKFTADEDTQLINLVNIYGTHSWKNVSKHMKNRTTRQCRERYNNYLSPSIKNGPWTQQEDILLISKVKTMGPTWCKIVSFFPTRSDVNIKNRYAYLVSKGRARALKHAIKNTKPKPKPIQAESSVELFNYALDNIDSSLTEKIFASDSIFDFDSIDLYP
ncbi:Myb-like DNA-binding domain containing protein [Trichomonas vaginalis G3]|uniref:Myb-like DNA-binding domain containing protein n=1 Tax=Trichomonas vaginalis (strain ATCC PRA-98 / G3) TaxID=412133 RepID=A2FMR7_TRIV3|nr:RNA polymerase II transcription regulator recruiting protein [Trichomonas vaginalis G3]EAX93781.1 Myb-like DNA-binding domain containing protein [Trichomonas vaginalis G3]KAI5527828.1 RNA polymerase II transcription regulator recruiting protein [Trichomonas vaginalis G3]|eukprot:XP_001306711.1 Myb-like DNA-binding domain containing protein [Trichomonas vaginalis G3]